MLDKQECKTNGVSNIAASFEGFNQYDDCLTFLDDHNTSTMDVLFPNCDVLGPWQKLEQCPVKVDPELESSCSEGNNI